MSGPPVRLRLRLFGAFRDVAREAELTVDVPAGTTVSGLRGHVKEALARSTGRRHDDLVDLAAVASDRAVLAESHLLDDAHACLSMLPPVCGG